MRMGVHVRVSMQFGRLQTGHLKTQVIGRGHGESLGVNSFGLHAVDCFSRSHGISRSATISLGST